MIFDVRLEREVLPPETVCCDEFGEGTIWELLLKILAIDVSFFWVCLASRLV